MAEQPKVVIRNLRFFFEPGQWVLRDINLDIYPREILAILGPAGSGRTTLLRILNRLIDLVDGSHVEGEIRVDGQDIYAPQVDVVELRRRIGMLFAIPLPLPGSIRENILYGLRLSGMRDRARMEFLVEKSLRQAALWDEVKDRLNDQGAALSGGQQQRLCLARVLALEPEIILLDAPTSGLDPISTAKVEASLQQLKTQYTILIVPHSIQQAARVADKAAFFLSGELVEYGAGDQLFTRPKDKRTEDYITGRFG